MCAGAKGHARVDFNDFFACFRFVRLPCRFDDDRSADLRGFEICLPVILPLAVVLTANLGLQAADIEPLAEGSCLCLRLELAHGRANRCGFFAPLFIVVHIYGHLRCLVP